MALGFFTPSGNPNVDMETRRKIALAMMARSKKFPTNLGEGIASVGQEIGDALAMRALLEETAASNVAADRALEKYTGAPRAEAEPDQRTTYAPPESMPPAVAAINAAAPQGPPIVPVPPPQARTLVPPTAPSGGAAPVAAGPGGMVEPGEFNEIDAADPRNRYRAPPAYLAPALERNIADPERRGYLGQLAGKEARSAGEVSPTGAAGPFQFTRSTGSQYGIPGDARFDPDASARAVNAFTNDNVAALTARLGREPTPGEMALAHQQGAGTAGNMLTGAGNASPSNLAVNNVPPGAGPQAAAQRIMGYYGMPGAAGAPASPRDAVTAALATQQQGGRPSVADYGQPMALAATPQQAISAAPPQQQVRAAPPPQQVAQARPAPQPGYVTDPGPEPKPPPTMTEVQKSIVRDIQNTPPRDREAVQNRLKPVYEQEQAKVKQWNDVYQDELKSHREMKRLAEEHKQKAAKDVADVAHVQAQTEAARLQDISGKMVRNSDGTYSPVKVTGVDPKAPPDVKLNESQTKTLLYHDWANLGNEAVKGKEKVLAEGMAQELLGKVPFGGNSLLNAKYRAVKTGADQFVNAFMRATSGGAYSDVEAAREAKALLPKVGDDPKTLENKAAQREAFIKNLYGGLGDGKRLADFYGNERKEKQQQKFEKLNSEMEGKDKSKTYQKNGVFREWVGDHWEEH